MLEYLKLKKEEIEAQRVERCDTYFDLEQKIEEYRDMLYAERFAEVAKKNMIIDAQVAILDEVLATAAAIEETKKDTVETDIVEETTVETEV